MILDKVPGKLRGKLVLGKVPDEMHGKLMLEQMPGEMRKKTGAGKSAWQTCIRKSAWQAARKTAEKVTEKVQFLDTIFAL